MNADDFLKKYASKHFQIRHGEKPLTKFVNAQKAINAKLIGWPDIDQAKNVLTNYAFSSWFKDFSELADDEIKEQAAKDLASGRVLGQGLESMNFTFILSGMSLHNSHAIVRTRIGATYLQQSQAVKDFRHSAILVPPKFLEYPNLMHSYIDITLAQKNSYIYALETDQICIDDARMFLGKNIPVWITVSYSLPSLLGAFSKRTDTQEEAFVFNLLFRQMRDRVLEKFPYLRELFREDSNCMHTKEGYRANCIYKRNEAHSQFEDSILLHNNTRDELLKTETWIDEFENFKFYVGNQCVTTLEYEEARINYGIPEIDDNL